MDASACKVAALIEASPLAAAFNVGGLNAPTHKVTAFICTLLSAATLNASACKMAVFAEAPLSAATLDASACEVAVLIKASLSAAMLDALACKASSSTATFYAPMYKMAVLIKTSRSVLDGVTISMAPLTTAALLINIEIIDMAFLIMTSSLVAMCVDFNVSMHMVALLAQQSVVQSSALPAGGLDSTIDHSTATDDNIKRWEWNRSAVPTQYVCNLESSVHTGHSTAMLANALLSTSLRHDSNQVDTECNSKWEYGRCHNGVLRV